MNTHTTITLIRHGETDWNREKRWQGHTDIPLNAMGRQQAQQAAQALQGTDATRIITSDLSRAHETAQIIGQALQLPVITDSRLREINVGEWQGLTSEEIKKHNPAIFERTRQYYSELRFPGGESRAELGQRAVAAMNDIAQNFPNQHTLVVAHGGTIQMILLSLLETYIHERMANCSLSHLIFENETWRSDGLGIPTSQPN